MRRGIRSVLVVTLVMTTGATAAACGGGDDSADDAARTADTVCTLLRRWNDELSDVINATSEAITDADDPTTANDVLVGGFEEAITVAEGHVTEVDQLSLPDGADRDALLDDLRTGAEKSVAVLEEERDEAAALGPIGIEQQRGALGGAFTGLERATSVLEPRAARYDEALQQAFADDAGCSNVIQPV